MTFINDDNLCKKRMEKESLINRDHTHCTVLTCTLSTDVMYLPMASRCSKYSRSSIGNDF